MYLKEETINTKKVKQDVNKFILKSLIDGSINKVSLIENTLNELGITDNDKIDTSTESKFTLYKGIIGTVLAELNKSEKISLSGSKNKQVVSLVNKEKEVKKTSVKKEVKVKYDANNPDNYYDEGSLLDKKGNLNILGVNMDYATGQLSASIKTDDGYIEILLPEGSTYRATDSFDLTSLASGLSAVQQGVAPVVTKDKNGNDVVVYIPLEKGYIPGTKILGSDYISAVEQDMNIILGDLFNFFGAEDIN